MNKILITGAAGFIGSHLVDLLVAERTRPEDIRLFVFKNESLRNIQYKGLDIFKGDIRNPQDVNKATNGINIIYHLAAKTSFDGTSYDDFKDTNVDGTKNILEACSRKNIKKFVYFSSIGVYGLPAEVGNIINWDESQPKIPPEGYGQSKLEAEKLVVSYCSKNSIPYAIVRPTTVYGPRDHQGVVALFRTIKNHQFFFIGSGQNKMDYVFVKDLVKGARLAELSKYEAGDYILGSGQPITFEEMVNTIALSLHEKVPAFHLPKLLGLLISYILFYGGKIVGIRSPLFPNRVRVITTNCYYNIKKAKRFLKYRPNTTFFQGCKETALWLTTNN